MKPVVPLMNESQARAWVALISVSELLPNALDMQLTADSALINFEYGILSVLNVAPRRTLRMGELATALGASAPKLSKAVTRLEKRAIVERVACADDGRAINVHLTREGRKVWLKATPPHIGLARDKILATLDEHQLTTLADLLEPLIETLDPAAQLGKISMREDPDVNPGSDVADQGASLSRAPRRTGRQPVGGAS